MTDWFFSKKGVSMIELVLVFAIAGALVFLVGSLPNSIKLIASSQKVSIAREIASKQIEEKRQLKYANLPYGEQAFTDSRLPGSSGIVLVEDCNPSICSLGELAKEVTVTVSWDENGQNRKIELKTIISENGLN